MNALHRLAGVQETSDNTPAPVPSNSLSAPAPPPKDSSDTRSQKRASLPINRRPSRRSLRSATSSASRPVSQTINVPDLPADYPPTPRLPTEHQFHTQNPRQASAAEGGGGGGGGTGVIPRASDERPSEEGQEGQEDDDDDDFVWGPSHPCFPHPNPHCLPASPAFHSTRVIRVRRDWLATGDLYPQYANLYPEILDPLVTDGEFRQLIAALNARCARAFSPFGARAWVDGLVGAFTGYLWEDLGWAGGKRGERELERFVEDWNREREDRGVRVVQLRRTGFMSLDIVIPDPGIDGVGEEEGEGEEIREALQA